MQSNIEKKAKNIQTAIEVAGDLSKASRGQRISMFESFAGATQSQRPFTNLSKSNPASPVPSSLYRSDAVNIVANKPPVMSYNLSAADIIKSLNKAEV